MTDPTTDPAPDRPLVTFALFAYNQEQYIREAVEGAFSQTYEPLEIILSDDCSSDRTFEIMQEMAAAYEGPHEVRVRRNEENVGTLSHVLTVMKEANGEYMVVAAGDDISSEDRTKIIISYMKKNELDVVSSTAIKFSVNDGKKLLIGETETLTTREEFVFKQKISRIHGATAAYRLNYFNNMEVRRCHALMEDTFFELVSYLRSYRIGFIKDSLVSYRIHAENTSPKVQASSLRELEERLMRTKLQASKVFECFTEECSRSAFNSKKICTRALIKSRYLKQRSRWYELSLIQRLRIFPTAIQIDGFSGMAARLFGFSCYKTFYSVLSGKVE